jgi:hypothetical protein
MRAALADLSRPPREISGASISWGSGVLFSSHRSSILSSVPFSFPSSPVLGGEVEILREGWLIDIYFWRKKEARLLWRLW